MQWSMQSKEFNDNWIYTSLFVCDKKLHQKLAKFSSPSNLGTNKPGPTINICLKLFALLLSTCNTKRHFWMLKHISFWKTLVGACVCVWGGGVYHGRSVSFCQKCSFDGYVTLSSVANISYFWDYSRVIKILCWDL